MEGERGDGGGLRAGDVFHALDGDDFWAEFALFACAWAGLAHEAFGVLEEFGEWCCGGEVRLLDLSLPLTFLLQRRCWSIVVSSWVRADAGRAEPIRESD